MVSESKHRSPIFVIVVLFMCAAALASVLMLLLAMKENSHAKTVIAHVVSNIAFMVSALLVLSSDYCNDQNIGGDLFLGMKFISTKLLQCKYSVKPECYVLPPLLVVFVSVMTMQLQYGLYIMRCPVMYVVNLMSYMSVFGFSSVVLFDSMTVSSRQKREALHITGVVLLCMSSWLFHWTTWYFGRKSMQEGIIFRKEMDSLKGLDYIYLLCLVIFVVLFVAQIPAAIQVEYAVLVFFTVLSLLNLWIQQLIIANTYKNGEIDEINETHTAHHMEEKLDSSDKASEHYKKFLAGVFTLCMLGIIIFMYLSS